MAEITNREDLENWLNEQPIEWSRALAVLSGLRVLPLVGRVFDPNRMEADLINEIILHSFHALSASWSTLKYPTHDLIIPSIASTFRSSNLAQTDSVIYAAILAAESSFAFSAATAATSASEAVGNSAAAAAMASIATTSSSNDARTASTSIWTRNSLDIGFLQKFTGSVRRATIALVERALWLDDQGQTTAPKWYVEEFNNLKERLLAQNSDWQVWTNWYQSRLDGRRSWGLSAKDEETLMLRIVDQNDDWWKQEPSVVNGEIAGWLKELQPPKEPEQGPGLVYGYFNGKLSASGSHPLPGEVDGQDNLQDRVKTKANKLLDLLGSATNQYPELAEAAAEYRQLIQQPIDQIDIDGLWSVGGALFELNTAYANQNHEKTMSSPLEPPQTAALSGLCRDHGAFILGFERGEELVQRADRFARNYQRAEEIVEPSKPVLLQLSDDRELVEEETRKLHKTILDALNETGWAVSRTSYSAYLTIRNGTLAMARLLFGSWDQGLVPIALSITGVAALAGYDVDQAAIINAVRFLQTHGAQLLAIFKHSPEMHAYVQAAIDLLEREKNRLTENEEKRDK